MQVGKLYKAPWQIIAFKAMNIDDEYGYDVDYNNRVVIPDGAFFVLFKKKMYEYESVDGKIARNYRLKVLAPNGEIALFSATEAAISYMKPASQVP